MRLNFLTLIMGKYLDIFVRKSKTSTSKQLSHLHYKNLQILKSVAPQFSLVYISAAVQQIYLKNPNQTNPLYILYCCQDLEFGTDP
jgi:hypothetical protein